MGEFYNLRERNIFHLFLNNMFPLILEKAE